MAQRFLRSLIALGAVVVAYQAYALLATPLLEPSLAATKARPATDQEWQGGKLAVARYQKLISGYFPPGHWTQQGTPIFIEYGQMLLALGDYQPQEGGRVELKRCAVVAFQTARSEGAPPPRDAIIVEAAQGATLQFEATFDPMGGQIGRPIAGVFPGELIIRSDMREAGQADDLKIVTRDLRFNQAMLRTDADVTLRLGPHSGGGKRLELRLIQDKNGGDPSAVSGVASLEIREGVWARMQLDNANGLGQPPGRAAMQPMQLTSAGPFRFDFTRFVASFHQDVRATQPNPGGPSDQLYCGELRLHFGDHGAQASLTPADEPELARSQGRLLGRMEPRLLEAIGDPVRLDSPSRETAIRGRWLRAWVGERRFRIDGAPATLAQGLSEVQAGWIDYAMPAEASGQTLGELSVSGPGMLRLSPQSEDPQQTFSAQWGAGEADQPVVTLRRDRGGNPLLKIEGRPQIAAAGLGRMRADRLLTQIREVAPDGPDGPAIELGQGAGSGGGSGGQALLLRRIDAVGSVEFQGREVEGQADDLVALFRTLSPEEAAGSQPGGPSRGPWQAESRQASDQRFVLSTRKLQLDIGLNGRRAEPTSLLCSGGVRLEQATTDPSNGPAAEPMRIVGEQLRVDGLNHHGRARLTVAGAAGDQPRPEGDPAETNHEGLAEVVAGGVRLWARDLHLDQAVGRLWTEGRGDALVRLARGADLLGPLGSEASLRWSDGLVFDGERITLSGDVFAEAANDMLHCRTLTARLTSPIDLRSGGSTEGVEIAGVECGGGVTIDHRAVDQVGQRSHERARLESLAIDRISGDITGRGRGWIRSVHLAGSSGGLGLGSAAEPSASRQPDGLRFLRVDFRRGLAGNLNDRALRFYENVQSVYGPVLAWDHELPLHSPGGVPPDAVELSCDELRVHEDPAAISQREQAGNRLGPIELVAIDSVRIDAAAGAEGGAVTAEAAKASYSQAADRFTLEGDGQRLATLWVQTDPNQPPVPSSAQRLTHYRRLGRTKIDDLRGIEFRSAPGRTRPTGPGQQSASRNSGPTR